MNRYLATWRLIYSRLTSESDKKFASLLMILSISLLSFFIFYSLGATNKEQLWLGSSILITFFITGYLFATIIIGNYLVTNVTNVTASISRLTQLIQANLLTIYISLLVYIPWLISGQSRYQALTTVILALLLTVLMTLIGIACSLIVRQITKIAIFRLVLTLLIIYLTVLAWPIISFINEQVLSVNMLSWQTTFYLLSSFISGVIGLSFLIDILLKNQTTRIVTPNRYWNTLTKFALTKFATNIESATFISEILRVVRDSKIQRNIAILVIFSILGSYVLYVSEFTFFAVLTFSQFLLIITILMIVYPLKNKTITSKNETAAFIASGVVSILVGVAIHHLVLIFFTALPDLLVVLPSILLTHISSFYLLRTKSLILKAIFISGLTIVLSSGFLVMHNESWVVGSTLMIWATALAIFLFILKKERVK